MCVYSVVVYHTYDHYRKEVKLCSNAPWKYLCIEIH